MIENKKRLGVFNGIYTETLIMKSLLESYNISVFQDNSLMGVFNPWGISVGGLNKSKLNVHEDDYEKAKSIIDEYNSTTRSQLHKL